MWSFGMPISSMLTPGDRRAVFSQGLLGLAGKLLEARGPTPYPISTGQALGSGLVSMLGTMNQAQDSIINRKMLEQKIKEQQQLAQAMEYLSHAGEVPYAPLRDSAGNLTPEAQRSLMQLAPAQAATQMMAPQQSAKAPTIRNFTEGTDVVARRFDPRTMQWVEVARGPRAAQTGENPLLRGPLGEKASGEYLAQSITAGENANLAQQLYQQLVDLGGGVTGIRAKISERGGGLAGQVPLIGATLERGIIKAVSDVTPEQLADFRVKSGALIARSVEPITGEGSSRVSDQEWARTATITKLDSATATPAQLGAALKSVARLNMLTEDRKHIMATGTPQFELKTDEQINAFGNDLISSGYSAADALDIVKEFLAHRESLRQKGILQDGG